MIRWLLSFFRCTHPHSLRHRDEHGEYWFVCEDCGDKRPVLIRTSEDARLWETTAKRLKRSQRLLVQSKRAKEQPATAANVVPMRKGGAK